MLEYVNKNRAYVKSLQEQVGVVADGIIGPQTLSAIEEYYEGPVISHKGKIIPIEFDGVINHKYSLDTLPDGSRNWYMRKQDIDNIVVHWGGLNALHCYQVFFNPKYAHATSHFLIGRNPNTEELEVLQCLDTAQVAWHAGKANKQSVGIDICQHPSVKYFEKTKVFYPGAELCQNRSKRGPSDIVDIDPELAEFANDFLWALREVLELSDKPVCKDDEVYKIADAKKFSILGHHNFSKQKWDPAPWADKLYHNLDEDYDV